MLLLGNTRRGGTYATVAFMYVTIVTSEHLSAEDKQTLRLPLREIPLILMLNDSETRIYIVE
jgi:hypothetical protein